MDPRSLNGVMQLCMIQTSQICTSDASAAGRQLRVVLMALDGAHASHLFLQSATMRDGRQVSDNAALSTPANLGIQRAHMLVINRVSAKSGIPVRKLLCAQSRMQQSFRDKANIGHLRCEHHVWLAQAYLP